MKKLLQILTVLIIVVGIILLAFSYVATIVYADDGYPAPIDNGYPVDYGYPIDEGYPMFWFPNWEYEQDFGYPVDVGYPVFEPELVSDTYQLDPQSNYRNGRNLWQEIVFQFSKLLDLMR